ncbi:hypothetical protein [uncultured Aquimarina sp.]|uniref:hypothetical protein n=1 Tax=uncultured Aquimarina sp. TaxID=575652 RepID=UPI00262AC9B3|nr:hypothetical protein [uncultured Aquimarina sp.]
MKKITLLVVTAVFAIGIQSCSTDEIGIEEVTLQELLSKKLTSNNSLEGPTSYCKIFAVFPSTTSSNERDVIRFQHMNSTESFGFFTFKATECQFIEIWRVDCSKIPREYGDGTVEGSTIVYNTRNGSDVDTEDGDVSAFEILDTYTDLESLISGCMTIML